MNYRTYAGSIIRTCALLLAILFCFDLPAFAQGNCLTNSLNISTGVDNNNLIAFGQNDPRWRITAIAPAFGAGYTPGMQAAVVQIPNQNQPGGAAVSNLQSNGSRAISLDQIWGFGQPMANTSVITLERDIRICNPGIFNFNFQYNCDNYIASMDLVSPLTGNVVQNLITNQPTQFGFLGGNGIPISVTNIGLQPGNYVLRVVLGNFGVPPNPTPQVNAIWFILNGTFTANSNAIVNDQDPSCANFACGGCNDDCYWRVQGNTILNGNNIFGTLSPNDVRIQTSATDRGILTQDGLFGWNNTAPTALLDVDCDGNNPDSRTGSNPSDVRFRDLEYGDGNIMAIDPNTGYVYDTEIPAQVGWLVEGNTVTINPITGLTENLLGTMNDEDIRIITSKQQSVLDRGVITKDGRFGWNTNGQASPTPLDLPIIATSRLHIDCKDGNDPVSPQAPVTPTPGNPGIGEWDFKSDIRFQNLEKNENAEELNVLGISPIDGYVYDTDLDINSIDAKDWDLDGNTLSGTEYIGSNNTEDFLIRTDVQGAGHDPNRPQMIVHGGNSGPQHGFVGINTELQTTNARLHVNCAGGNDPSAGGLSDVRFQDLEQGDEGSILIINDNGFVYDSRIPFIDLLNNITAACSTDNYVPRWNGSQLDCGALYDDGSSVGINTTGPFTYSGGVLALDVAGDARATIFVTASDARFKTNITAIENPFSIINNLNGKMYNWNDFAKNKINADNRRHYGFIAQEVEKFMPEAVIKDDAGNYAVEYNAFIPVLTEGQKELYQMLEEEKAKNKELLNRLTSLEARLAALEQPTSIDDNNGTISNKLYQNVPNPFGSETEIKYEINKMEQSAYIIVYDLNGRELMKHAVDKGTGSIRISSARLIPGMYMYALVIDGKPEDTKRMVFSD